jgi:predicted CoA-binding protein
METMSDKAKRFLAQRRIAVVGVSHSRAHFSRALLRELLRRGYDAVPVSATAQQAEGRPCFARLQDVQPPVSGALLLTPPAQTQQAVRDCLQAGIRSVWIHRGAGPGSSTPEALALCRAGDVDLVSDLCPFMALSGAGWPHRLHGFFRRRAHGHAAPPEAPIRLDGPRAH